MRKITKIILTITSAALFLAGSILSILDLFGIVDIAGNLWAAQDILPNLINILIILVGTIGISLILERLILINQMGENVAQINSSTTEITPISKTILEIVSDIRKKKMPAIMYSKREDSYNAFTETLNNLPADTLICVTHFEKYRGASYDIGEVEAEKRFMELWFDKVNNGDLSVRQIVHVSSIFDLNEVEDRIKQFSGASNFLLNVMYGPPIRPFLDLIVIRDNWAMIDFSNNPTSPFEDAISLALSDIQMVNELERYFGIWWSRFSIPVKDRDGIKTEVLLQLKDMLPSQSAETWIDQSFELSLRIAKEKEIHENLFEIVREFSKINNSPLPEVFKSNAITYLTECKNNIKDLSNDVVELEPIQSTILLATIFEEAHSEVNAVSCDIDQGHFWDSSLGKRVLRANAQAVERGVNIQRIFIISQSEQGLKRVHQIIKEHLEAGVDVLIADSKGLPEELMIDHLIQDNKLVFELDVNEEGSLMNKGIISINKTKVEKMKQVYNMLKYKSIDAKEFFKNMEAKNENDF